MIIAPIERRSIRRRRPRRGGAGLALLAVLIIVALAVTLAIATAPQKAEGAVGGWHTDFDTALATADAEGRNVVVLFTADWCPPCRILKKKILADGDVSDLLENDFVPVKIDLTESGVDANALAQQCGIQGIPTMLVLDADGYQLDEMLGAPPSPSIMIDWLRNNR